MVKEGRVAGPALAPVVTGKNDQRILRNALAIQFSENFTNPSIDSLEHRPVNRARAVEHIFFGDERSGGSVGRLKWAVDG